MDKSSQAIKHINITDPEIEKELLLAYIKDTREHPTPEVQQRFHELLEKSFKDHNRDICLRSQRIGVNTAVTLSGILVRTGVTRLDLYENVIRDHGCEVLATLVKELPNLTYLNVGANDIGPSAATAMITALATHRRIQTIVFGSEKGGDVHTNRLDGTAGRAIAETLQRARTIRTLDLGRNPIGRGTSGSQEAFTMIARVLATPGLCNLQVLKLGGTGLGTDAAVELVRAIAVTTTMQELDLHDNDLGSQIGAEIGRLLAQRHSSSPPHALRVLDLRNNPRIGDRGCTDIVQVLGSDDGLDTLCLSMCGIRDGALSVLCHALPTNRTLTHLDMSTNDISAQGAHELSQALVWHPSLKYLNLSSNRITDDGACALAGMVEANNVLQTLELQDTRISDRGTIAFGVALASNQRLTTLRLNDNQISDDGGKALVPLLEKNTSVLHCHVSANSIDHSTAMKIKAVTQRNQRLKADELPHQLQREVVRLHYQKYKLDEARNALEVLKKSKMELERTQEKFELAAREEEQEARHRGKDLQSKIQEEEARTLDLQQRIIAKQDELAAYTRTWEANMEILQGTLAGEIKEREKAEELHKGAQKQMATMEENRVKTEKELTDKLKETEQERERWKQMAREYRSKTERVMAKVKELETLVAATVPMSARRRSSAAPGSDLGSPRSPKTPKKKPGSAGKKKKKKS
eukprot:PhM_4_TR10063/c0_g1_i1/m.103852